MKWRTKAQRYVKQNEGHDSAAVKLNNIPENKGGSLLGLLINQHRTPTQPQQSWHVMIIL